VSGFKDHFSGHAAGYARNRPGYPPALFAWLASQSPALDRAWDCGTGSGQAAVPLADHFAAVVATDPSAEQIRNAAPHPRVTYRVAPAEESGLEEGSASLVSVAQALHWFDLPRFWAEAGRVLKPGGLLAAWTYPLMSVTPAVDAVVGRFYDGEVGPYWPPERRLVDEEYRTIAFPWTEVEVPSFAIELGWTLGDLLAYVRTWSAVQRYRKQHGTDPVDGIERELADAWGAADAVHAVHWPLVVRAVRKPSAGA
jgi:SAM-dependent methyltransferase